MPFDRLVLQVDRRVLLFDRRTLQTDRRTSRFDRFRDEISLKTQLVELDDFWQAVDNSKSRVAQRYPYPLHSATPHSSVALPLPVAQCNPIIYRTFKDHPEDHNPPEAGEDMSGSFELDVARASETKSSRKQSARRINVEIGRAHV